VWQAQLVGTVAAASASTTHFSVQRDEGADFPRDFEGGEASLAIRHEPNGLLQGVSFLQALTAA
jgi:hypothetical protein